MSGTDSPQTLLISGAVAAKVLMSANSKKYATAMSAIMVL